MVFGKIGCEEKRENEVEICRYPDWCFGVGRLELESGSFGNLFWSFGV
jgi:hypothetical protein